MDHGDIAILLEVESEWKSTLDQDLENTELHPEDYPTEEIPLDDEQINNMVESSERPYYSYMQPLSF